MRTTHFGAGGRRGDVVTRGDQLSYSTKKDDHRRASIGTSSGGEFFPLDALPSEVLIENIANSLGQKVRYTGQATQFYTIAEHSIRVSKLLEEWGEPVEVQFQGLMHDAQEAYLPDVASPVKATDDFSAFREIEHRLAAVVAEAFGFGYPLPRVVKEADADVFKHEYREIMPEMAWWRGEPPRYEQAPIVEDVDWRHWKAAFLLRYHKLQAER